MKNSHRKVHLLSWLLLLPLLGFAVYLSMEARNNVAGPVQLQNQSQQGLPLP